MNDVMGMFHYECSNLIKEVKQDVVDFGSNCPVAVWCKKISVGVVYTNYDFLVEEKPISSEELKQNEYIEIMTLATLLQLLEKQNEMFFC